MKTVSLCLPLCLNCSLPLGNTIGINAQRHHGKLEWQVIVKSAAEKEKQKRRKEKVFNQVKTIANQRWHQSWKRKKLKWQSTNSSVVGERVREVKRMHRKVESPAWWHLTRLTLQHSPFYFFFFFHKSVKTKKYNRLLEKKKEVKVVKMLLH